MDKWLLTKEEIIIVQNYCIQKSLKGNHVSILEEIAKAQARKIKDEFASYIEDIEAASDLKLLEKAVARLLTKWRALKEEVGQ